MLDHSSTRLHTIQICIRVTTPGQRCHHKPAQLPPKACTTWAHLLARDVYLPLPDGNTMSSSKHPGLLSSCLTRIHLSD